MKYRERLNVFELEKMIVINLLDVPKYGTPGIDWIKQFSLDQQLIERPIVSCWAR